MIVLAVAALVGLGAAIFLPRDLAPVEQGGAERQGPQPALQ
jgi:hypothetical protein